MMRKIRHGSDVSWKYMGRSSRSAIFLPARPLWQMFVTSSREVACVLYVHRRVESKTRPATEDARAGGP
jgi:hypothetical protein